MLYTGEDMADIFAVRNVDEKTKEFIYNYAHEHDVNLGDALRELVYLVEEHLREREQQKHKKKYVSFFEIYDKVKFSGGDSNLSKNMDEVLYGKRRRD